MLWQHFLTSGAKHYVVNWFIVSVIVFQKLTDEIQPIVKRKEMQAKHFLFKFNG